MTLEQIKLEIYNLSIKYHNLQDDVVDEMNETEWIEEEVETLIVSYCENKGFLIQGFPTEKRALTDLDDDYFCRERFRLYLDKLSLQKDDVADLYWYYHKCFWPEFTESKKEFLTEIQLQLDSEGFYDVEL